MKILVYNFFIIIFFINCSQEKISKLDSEESLIAFECGENSINLGKQYYFFKIMNENNKAFSVKDLFFGTTNNSRSINEDIVTTENCLAVRKNTKMHFYIYSIENGVNKGTILDQALLSKSEKFNRLKLSPFDGPIEVFKACGRVERGNKKRLLATKIKFNYSYKKNKNLENYEVKIYKNGKQEKGFEPNNLDCLFFSEKEKNRIVEISNKQNGEVIFRRPLAIWKEYLNKEIKVTKIEICNKEEYEYNGQCLSHFNYYCEQEMFLSSGFQGFIKDLKEDMKETNCTKLEEKIKDEKKIYTYYSPDSMNPEPIYGLQELKVLSISKGIKSDLSLIRNLVNLEELSISDGFLVNISELSMFHKLRKLNLNKNQINDISALKNLVNLQELNLSNNQIKNIDSLIKLSQITKLDLSDNLIEGISSLTNLSVLKELNLSSNKVIDFTFLGDISSLTTLTLNNSKLEQLDAIAKLKKLTFLSLDSNKISSIQGIGNLSQLVSLSIKKNRINDLSPIKSNLQITGLHLENNHIEDISSLQYLKNLKNIYLDGNQLKDVSPINSLGLLEVLYLKNTGISDIFSLTDLKKLFSFDISFNNIVDISVFETMDSLMSVNLERNKITDISPIGSLKYLDDIMASHNLIKEFPDLSKTNIKYLQYVNLDHNQIEKIPALPYDSEIEHLILNNNRIKEIEPFLDVSKLMRLDLENNQIEDLNPLKDLQYILTFKIKNNPLGTIISKSTTNCPLDAKSAVIANWCSTPFKDFAH